MWLIDRDSDGMTGRRIPLPASVRTALVQWYLGEGSRADEAAGIALVQQARIGERWIACDCLTPTARPPILTPAFLSEAETYYLRRLTSSKRPEHDPGCPFFHDQMTHRLSEVRGPDAPAEPPSGFFAVLKPAPEKLAQRPAEDASDDRTRQASVPRLARLLWRLLDVAGLNRCPTFAAGPPEHSIAHQFRRLSSAAHGIEVAPGIELGRVFWTHPQALRRRRVYAALRELAERWPSGHAPQGFLVLFANAVRGQNIDVADGEPIRIANRVQSPSSRENPVNGPYLAIIVAGQYPEAHGYAPLRAYAQPVYSGHRFIPIGTALERATLRGLLAAQREAHRAGIDMRIEKPIFDKLTTFGPCRPDFLVETCCRATGEIKRVAIETFDPDYPVRSAGKEASMDRLRSIMPALALTRVEIEAGRVGTALAAALSL